MLGGFGLVACLAAGAAASEPQPPQPAAVEAAAPATLQLNHRHIVEFRATLLGDTPAERVAMAQAVLQEVLGGRTPAAVTRSTLGEAVRFEVGGRTVFFLVEGDVAGPRPAAMLEPAAAGVQRRLATALQEAREVADPRLLSIGAAWSAGATLGMVLVLRVLWALRRAGLLWLGRRLRELRPAGLAAETAGVPERGDEGAADRAGAVAGVFATYRPHLLGTARAIAGGLTWLVALLLVELWAGFVLRQFAYTRPWGEAASAWLLDVLGRLALSAAAAVPGLLTALLIFVVARMGTRAWALLLGRVERGELQLGWLDVDTAAPTRLIGSFVIWLFALGIAYPYLPGASTESFKGVTVLAGLMLSLGASSVVGQAMSGVSLMYSRSLRPGEYVRVGETEGTVTSVGMFATKIHTGLGEEVSLPNTYIVGQPVRNFSRLVQGGQFVLHTALTIGYATPWRHVHAMLLEAARRTPGIAADPAPYVMQTALSDFYVEYRLCAQTDRSAPRRRAEAMNRLLANVQDVFAENGVQIMSPHYMADPAAPQVPPAGQGSVA